MTQTLVQQMWGKIDAEVANIFDAKAGEPNELTRQIVMSAQIRARAIAECLAIFMPPFFTTADEISREAARRHKAKAAGEEYETPGMGHLRYATASKYASRAEGWHTTSESGYTSNREMAGTPKRGRGVPNAPQVTLSEQDQKSIRYAYTTDPKMFTPQKLATTYRVSLAMVNTILGI